METVLVVALIGLAGGVAVGFQGPLASMIGGRIGIMESIFIVHLGGMLASGLVLLLRGYNNLGAWRTVPWYALGAGVFGLVVIGAVNYTIPRLGIAGTITLVVVGQLLVGLIADHFGLLEATVRPIDLARLLGVALLLLGTWLIMR